MMTLKAKPNRNKASYLMEGKKYKHTWTRLNNFIFLHFISIAASFFLYDFIEKTDPRLVLHGGQKRKRPKGILKQQKLFYWKVPNSSYSSWSALLYGRRIKANVLQTTSLYNKICENLYKAIQSKVLSIMHIL